jgi:hypothetical protein
MGLTVNTRSHNATVTNLGMGFVTTDGAAAAPTNFNCGFVPRYVKWVNVTDNAMTEWFDGMPSGVANCVAIGTVAAGTRAATAPGAGIIIGTPALTSAGYFTIPAALIPASKSFAWMAMG